MIHRQDGHIFSQKIRVNIKIIQNWMYGGKNINAPTPSDRLPLGENFVCRELSSTVSRVLFTRITL